MRVHVQNTLLSSHGRSLQAEGRASHKLYQKHHQVLQHISQRHQSESHKEHQQKCNSDQLNFPIKNKTTNQKN